MVRTAAAYFDVLVAIESLAAAETNEAAGKRQFDYADKRLEVGLGADHRRARSPCAVRRRPRQHHPRPQPAR